MSKFAALTAEELAQAETDNNARFAELTALENPSDDEVEEASALADDLDELAAEKVERETKAAEKAQKFEALKARKFGADAQTEPEPEPEPEPVEEPEAEVEPEPEPEPAPVKASNVKKVAAKSQRPETPQTSRKRISITASANVPEFANGHKFTSLEEVAEAVINRAKTFTPPTGDGTTIDLQKFSTAKFEIDYPEDLTIDRHSDVNAVLDHAVDETRLDGGSLVAAAGWCAPSETSYDLDDDSTTEGMVSLPEVAVKRGGMRFAASPTFAAFYANPGFIQTEAQAIAGTVKPCVEVPCPTFTDVRLDAEGLCIKVPILLNAAYPEVVRQFVSGTMTAHQHWINANVIGRLVTASGAARVFAGLGSSYNDSLEALGLVIDQTRQKYRLGLKATVEVILPFWVKNVLKADLRRRIGQTGPVTDQQINAEFSQVGANVQFVYDWQAIDETAEVYPATFQALVYPAGTFVKGNAPVITLNTVYDAASLAVNTYTGLFTEQGLLVAKKKFHSDLLTIPICNAGRTGASNFTCA